MKKIFNKIINIFKKPKIQKIEISFEDLRLVQLKEFRKDFKKMVNSIEGGNIPGVTILHSNVWTEKNIKGNN